MMAKGDLLLPWLSDLKLVIHHFQSWWNIPNVNSWIPEKLFHHVKDSMFSYAFLILYKSQFNFFYLFEPLKQSVAVPYHTKVFPFLFWYTIKINLYQLSFLEQWNQLFYSLILFNCLPSISPPPNLFAYRPLSSLANVLFNIILCVSYIIQIY